MYHCINSANSSYTSEVTLTWSVMYWKPSYGIMLTLCNGAILVRQKIAFRKQYASTWYIQQVHKVLCFPTRLLKTHTESLEKSQSRRKIAPFLNTKRCQSYPIFFYSLLGSCNMPGGTYEHNWDLSQPTFANKFAYFITFLGEKNMQKFALYSLAIFYDFVVSMVPTDF